MKFHGVALVRIAVDVPIQHVDKLRGDTEDEIRESILRALRGDRHRDGADGTGDAGSAEDVVDTRP